MCIRLLHGLAFPGVYSERVRFTSLVGENCAPIQVVASRLSTVIATLCTAICSAPFEHLTSASWNGNNIDTVKPRVSMGLLKTVPFGTAYLFHMGVLANQILIGTVIVETNGTVPH